MDVSPVQSGSKCSSDFSIERILSDDARSNREESSEAPSWLCCTRYRPPRLPRSSGLSSACRARRSGRHARVPFTASQAAALEAAYARAPYLAPPALRALAAALQLRDDRIKIWFQNRRARERREKSSTITPPQDVTLPPTQGILSLDSPWVSFRKTSIQPLAGGNNARMNDTCPVDIEIPHNLSTTVSSTNIPTYYTPSFNDARDEDSRSDVHLDVESIEE